MVDLEADVIYAEDDSVVIVESEPIVHVISSVEEVVEQIVPDVEAAIVYVNDESILVTEVEVVAEVISTEEEVHVIESIEIGSQGIRGPMGSVAGSFGCSIDGAGTAILPGVKQAVVIPFACTITGWSIVGSPVGDVVLDIWKKAGVVPTGTDTITGTEKPSLTGALVNSGTVASWIKNVAAGDVIVFNVDTCLLCQKLTLVIAVLK